MQKGLGYEVKIQRQIKTVWYSLFFSLFQLIKFCECLEFELKNANVFCFQKFCRHVCPVVSFEILLSGFGSVVRPREIK